MTSAYQASYDAWQDDPQRFWGEAAKAVDWFCEPTAAFDAGQGIYGRWFADGLTNTCFNCLDRHVDAGHGARTAIIHDSPVTGKVENWSYQAVLDEVRAVAAAFRALGVHQGDRIILYMPMIPQALFAMLAAARIGAVHSVVFGGFAASELAARIDDSGAVLIVCASCGIEPRGTIAYKPLVDAALDMAQYKPRHCLVLQRDRLHAEMRPGRDVDFDDAVEQAKAEGADIACVPVAAIDPLYILYTSGTTGKPKGIVRDTGGHLVALTWTMRNFFGVAPGEVFWAASDIGWVVGHSYIVYAPLFAGCTTVLYEGKPVGTPDAGAFWRVIAQHKVRALLTAPTAIRAIRKDDPEAALAARYDVSSLRALFLAGERADPDTIRWAETLLGVPVIDHWWQTETGWPIAGNPLGLGLLPVKHGSPAMPMPGYAVDILDDTGQPVGAGTLGNVAIRLPLPPGCLPTFWNADDRFRETCLADYPGYYKTADAGYLDEDGYLFIMSRTDDIINVAGHRLSTGAMEEICASHPDIAECAVVGIADALKGQVPAGFLVVNARVSRETSVIESEVVALVRERIGPVAAFKTAICVKRLPKTRSGKILRSTIQKIADGVPWTMPATIEDPAVLDEIRMALNTRNIGV